MGVITPEVQPIWKNVFGNIKTVKEPILRKLTYPLNLYMLKSFRELTRLFVEKNKFKDGVERKKKP